MSRGRLDTRKPFLLSMELAREMDESFVRKTRALGKRMQALGTSSRVPVSVVCGKPKRDGSPLSAATPVGRRRGLLWLHFRHVGGSTYAGRFLNDVAASTIRVGAGFSIAVILGIPSAFFCRAPCPTSSPISGWVRGFPGHIWCWESFPGYLTALGPSSWMPGWPGQLT